MNSSLSQDRIISSPTNQPKQKPTLLNDTKLLGQLRGTRGQIYRIDKSAGGEKKV
jgi:hypothetical protein